MMTLYRIVYPPDQDTFGWKQTHGIRTGAPGTWAMTLFRVTSAISVGVWPVRVVQVADGSTHWDDAEDA